MAARQISPLPLAGDYVTDEVIALIKGSHTYTHDRALTNAYTSVCMYVCMQQTIFNCLTTINSKFLQIKSIEFYYVCHHQYQRCARIHTSHIHTYTNTCIDVIYTCACAHGYSRTMILRT